MLPQELQADQFHAYPPQAQRLAVAHVQVFRQLPLSFLPGLLREARSSTTTNFQQSAASIDKELATLSSSILRAACRVVSWLLSGFTFVETRTPRLGKSARRSFSSRNPPIFGRPIKWMPSAPRRPPMEVGSRRRWARRSYPCDGLALQSLGKASPPTTRHSFAISGATERTSPRSSQTTDWSCCSTGVEARARSYPVPYGHWYVDGGQAGEANAFVDHRVVSARLHLSAPICFKFMQAQIASPGMGPEELRTNLARLSPADLGMDEGWRPRAGPFSGQAVHRGFGHPDLQHHIRSMDGPRIAATCSAAHVVSPLRATATAEAHERVAL